MIYIYSDSQIIDLEWIPRFSISEPFELCHNLAEFENATADHKIAFSAHRLHLQHDSDINFEIKMRRLSNASDIVFCLDSELHKYHWTIWSQCHRDNIYWALPGAVNDREDMSRNIVYWGDWFKTTSALYKKLPHVIDQFNPYLAKPKYFDALLGSPKPHRTFLAKAVTDAGLESKFVLTYGGRWNNREFYAKDYFIYEPGTVVTADTHLGTMDWAEYHGHQCHLSQIIPISVFNETAYSVVAETDHENTLSFFSEKTVKPIIARRLFVVFSGYKFLENLRNIGFRTFDGIIDESYDTIKHDSQRYQAAFEQIKYLCHTPQEQILDKIKPIVEHNYQLMMSTDWTGYTIDRFQKIYDTVITGTAS